MSAVMIGGLRVSIAAVMLATAATASGQAADGKIRIDGAWARRATMLQSNESKGGSGNGAVYATLVNPGTEADALVAATSDVAGAVEIHETYQESGMVMMRAVEKIDIQAGQKVELKPGGYHIMLLNIKRNLAVGQSVELTLVFQKAGQIPTTAQVR